MTFGSLFAGIGGFDLGFERAGMTCSWQVEIDPYCRRVLAKHWPRVPKFGDVRHFPPPAGDFGVDVICGGFPCQDISNAGKRAGIDGERSGLWSEIVRTVRVLRPRYVVVENVSALLTRGMDRVLGDLASLGFDAEWHCIPAAAVGAPHGRDRVWLVAYAASMFCDGGDDHGSGCRQVRLPLSELRDGCRAAVPVGSDWEGDHPGVLRMADGIPDRVDRLRGLGNAVVPQVAEWIGRRLIECNR